MRQYLEGIIIGPWPIFQMEIYPLYETQAGFISKAKHTQRTTCDSLLLGMLQALLLGMKNTSPPGLVQVFSVLLDSSTQLGFASLFHCGAFPNETGLGHCQSHRQREELQVRGCG